MTKSEHYSISFFEYFQLPLTIRIFSHHPFLSSRHKIAEDFGSSTTSDCREAKMPDAFATRVSSSFQDTYDRAYLFALLVLLVLAYNASVCLICAPKLL